jgi:hypothetical protein
LLLGAACLRFISVSKAFETDTARASSIGIGIGIEAGVI